LASFNGGAGGKQSATTDQYLTRSTLPLVPDEDEDVMEEVQLEIMLYLQLLLLVVVVMVVRWCWCCRATS
jgi:hypothetical protein